MKFVQPGFQYLDASWRKLASRRRGLVRSQVTGTADIAIGTLATTNTLRGVGKLRGSTDLAFSSPSTIHITNVRHLAAEGAISFPTTATLRGMGNLRKSPELSIFFNSIAVLNNGLATPGRNIGRALRSGMQFDRNVHTKLGGRHAARVGFLHGIADINFIMAATMKAQYIIRSSEDIVFGSHATLSFDSHIEAMTGHGDIVFSSTAALQRRGGMRGHTDIEFIMAAVLKAKGNLTSVEDIEFATQAVMFTVESMTGIDFIFFDSFAVLEDDTLSQMHGTTVIEFETYASLTAHNRRWQEVPEKPGGWGKVAPITNTWTPEEKLENDWQEAS